MFHLSVSKSKKRDGGSIFGKSNRPKWRYSVEKNGFRFKFKSVNAKGKTVLTIIRENSPKWEYKINDPYSKQIGVMKKTNLFRTKFVVEYEDFGEWTFLFPLFKTYYGGFTQDGIQKVWMMPAPRDYDSFLLFENSFAEIPIVQTMACIHYMRLNNI